MNSIRAKVVCVLRNAERMLLICATDPHDGQSFLLPPGGGVKFGETLESAVRRELFEEVGIQLPAVRRVGMLETFFKFAGRPEHELVFVYEAECDAPDLCDRDAIEIIESNGERLPARWYTPAEIAATGLPVFPEGVLELLNCGTGPSLDSL